MKKVLNRISFFLLSIFMLTFLFLQYLKSDLNQSIPKAELELLKAEIRLAKALPKPFLETYNSINSIGGTSKNLFDQTLGKEPKACPCLDAAKISQNHNPTNKPSLGNAYVLAWKLEREFSQEQCLNYFATILDFHYQNIGIDDAAQYYFNSSVDSLNEDQIKILVLMFQNPFQYNPKANPEKLAEALRKLKP